MPGDVRAPFEYAPQARQVLNDAEDDLKDWRLELDDLSQLDNAAATSQTHKNGETAVDEAGGATERKNNGVQRTESTVDESRLSSGTSLTGAADQAYSASQAPSSIPV